MFKTALNKNIIPHTWKLANIVPISKPNKDTDKGTSYRPISLLSVIANTLEKSLLPYITANIPNTPMQHGYKTQHSTVMALHTLNNTVAKGFNQTQSLETVHITEEMVHKKLQSLRSDQSPGPDKLHPRIPKELAKELTTPLESIYNKYIDKGTLPSQWKTAIITPIFKRDASRTPAIYRPVSLTSVVCKVLEGIISEKILEHIKSKSLQCPQQNGFTTGRSTTTNLAEAVNIWSEALSDNIPVDVIFLDYAKAFDTVPHIRLGNQIETFGISGKSVGMD